MPLFDTSDFPAIGRFIRDALSDALTAAGAADRTGAMLDENVVWAGPVLRAVNERLGVQVEDSAVNELEGIAGQVRNRLLQDNADAKDLRNAVDNFQSMLIAALLITDLRETTAIDDSAIQAAYRLTCPVYPCMPAGTVGAAAPANSAEL